MMKGVSGVEGSSVKGSLRDWRTDCSCIRKLTKFFTGFLSLAAISSFVRRFVRRFRLAWAGVISAMESKGSAKGGGTAGRRAAKLPRLSSLLVHSAIVKISKWPPEPYSHNEPEVKSVTATAL